MKFTLSLDVRDAIYTAIGDADLTGLGPDMKTNYATSEAHIEQIDETTWELEIEVELKAGTAVPDDEIVEALRECFDGELVVDINDLEYQPGS